MTDNARSSEDRPFLQNLAALKGLLETTLLSVTDETTSHSIPSTRSEMAAWFLHQRRVRDKMFGDDAKLFGEPSWDILLDLYARRGGKPVSVSSAAVASRVPATTALRWIATLETRGLVFRKPDVDDLRIRWLELTDRGTALLDGVFDAALTGFKQ